MSSDFNPYYNYDSDALMNLITAFQKSRIILTACELDIFNALGKDSKTAGQVASDIQTDERATGRLLNALVALNILEKNKNLYSNNKSAQKYLVNGASEYFGNVKHLNHLWDIWNNLTDVIKQGKPSEIDFEKNSTNLENFVSSMHFRAKQHVVELTDLIDFSDIIHVLDLGGCSGAYSMEFSRAKPLLKCTIFDLPEVIPHTRKILEDAGFSYKIELLSGDMFTDDIGKGYDMIFASNILHSYSLWENIKLLERCYDALKYNGKLIIHDMMLNEDKVTPPANAVFNINMLVNTTHGETYTLLDLFFMLKEAWFSIDSTQHTAFGSDLIFAHK
ncbi:MAG: methyltransferase [Candidatus Kapabacteria bacterium]|nr:methyltransferase [Candidatus Kapabacteria bacterium]